MGVINLTRGRNDLRIVQGITGLDLTGLKYEVNVSATNNSNDRNNSNSNDSNNSTHNKSTDIEQASVDTAPEKPPQRNSHRTTQGAYIGVQKAEAAALAWSKKSAYGTFALIWVSFFILALQSSISSNVIQNAYANFEAAPQVSTANILASVIGGVLKLPTARMLNIWGRTEGFLVFVGIYLLGLVLLAACNNPNSYAAGYVLYWVGYDAIYLVLDVFVADTSGLRNRAFAFGFASTPFICTAFTGPIAAESFLKHASWRWAYGTFAIVTPFVFLPLAAVFKFYQRKAERMCLFVREPNGRTKLESVIHYIHEFDVIGALILMAAFLLVLLPFSMQSYGRTQYDSPTFIALLVIGFCLFFVFAIWERFFARKHFIEYDLFKQRTVLGACFLAAFLFFSYYTWDNYFYNFCMVVYNLPVSLAGYIGQIYNVGSCLWSAIFGIIVYWTRQFKYTCLGFGIPLILLGAGLMIHFRVPGDSVGYMVMCQIFIAVAGGTLIIGADMAVMAAADREGVPMMLSMVGLFSSLGGAIGYAVSATIYSNTFPGALQQALPADVVNDYQRIYSGGYIVQKSYPVGSAARQAIDYAWGEYMKYACIAAVATMALGIPAVAVWRNYRVDTKQNKGEVM